MQSAETFLQLSQNSDGGWGYGRGYTSSVEPTAAAVLALRGNAAAGNVYARGVQWLLASQHADGGWGLTAGDDQSGWQTAWALLALARDGLTGEPLQRGLEWLSHAPVLTIVDDDMQRTTKQLMAIDATLNGWPWLPSEASWVEPTALALLALQVAPDMQHDTARAEQAVQYLLDRRCIGGGWNVGNPVMFDSPLPARAVPTAWTLLALAGAAPDTVTAEDLAALEADARQDGGALALAWAGLALRMLGHAPNAILAQLAALQSSDGSWNANPYHTAVALLSQRGQL